MTNSFGYLTKEGYGGHVFPVIFGEVGSHLTAVRGLPHQQRCLHSWRLAQHDREQ